MEKNGHPDDEVIARLREKAERLECLEARLEALEKERNDLIDTKEELSGELANYRLSLKEWEWFFEHSVQMLCIAGMDGYLKRVNPAFANTLGYTPEELTSRPFIDFVHPEDVRGTLREFKGLGVGRDSISFENRYLAKDGSWRWIAWYCPGISSVTNKLFAIARDITTDRLREAEILYRASHDSLTGLHNRAAFEESLEDAMAQQRRNLTGEVVLYLVDIDGFKNVNDRYGHMAGDHLLQVLSKRFQKIQRAGEMVAIGCSVGIATFPRTAADFCSLISQADKAMYAIKKSGKNGFRKFDPSLN